MVDTIPTAANVPPGFVNVQAINSYMVRRTFS